MLIDCLVLSICHVQLYLPLPIVDKFELLDLIYVEGLRFTLSLTGFDVLRTKFTVHDFTMFCRSGPISACHYL